MKRSLSRLFKLNWKYAIGELFLIVLGILIALFISNLNDNRKLKQFEKEIMNEISESLASDLDFHIENRINRGNRIVQSAEVVLDYLEGETEYHDSLEFHFWKMNWIMIFEPQTIPFERLKSKGIEVLSDEDIRLGLLELFDVTYPRISYFTEDYNDWTNARVEPFCFKHFEIKNLDKGKKYSPVNLEQLKESIEYKNLVQEKMARTESLIDRVGFAKWQAEKLLKSIKENNL